MPRRPKNSSGKNKRPRPPKRSEATLKKWNTFSDIPLDEEDQFHASRDKILLDGEDVEDSFEDEDEVFALKGLSDDLEEEGTNEEEGAGNDGFREAEDLDTSKRPGSKKSKDQKKKRKKEPPSLPEESEAEEEEESWGRSKSAYYSSNVDQIDSDDEEAQELEEKEAIRLQAKARDGMDEDDFGLNDPRSQDINAAEDLTEPAFVAVPSLPKDKKSLFRHLEKNNPEALALAGDWDDSVQNLFKTRYKLEKLKPAESDPLTLGMIHLYYQILLTYTTNLAFYLHLRANKYSQRLEQLRVHPILARLLSLKQALSTLEDLDLTASDSDDELDDDVDDIDIDLDEAEVRSKLTERFSKLESEELNQLLKDALLHINDVQPGVRSKPPKKKRKVSESISEPSQPTFDLVEPEFKSVKMSSRSQTRYSTSDIYGEALSLQHADAADKSARRKSLRFHTSKIEGASARRQGARQAMGGDDDIPYRQREKEREARRLKEVKESVKNQGGADLDDVAPEERENAKAKGSSDEESALDGYYDLVKRKSQQRKEKKKAEYEATQAALRPSVDEVDIDGPRSLTKAILTNRGLTPRRPKSARNPRVKKREKYEKAKRKVASQKAVYKGGISETGRYDGEKSGISKVVKSVRLG
ncbi:hypothetical protein AX17_004986 [Amanita inopinata Kibby_2008]|nr:hypothetical protein AX17_004986 [Amanita inopinata Kibby_2008]